MPDPNSDADQLRFAQIRSLILDSLVKNLPEVFLEQSGAKSRKGLRDRLAESEFLVAVIEVCAFEALKIEEEARK
jgi:hypothetical protein